MGYILGLDIGVASVGYAIIDENYNVLISGVRLFREGTAEDNVARRGFRSSRRSVRRSRHRLDRLTELLSSVLGVSGVQSYTNLYEVRVRGLSNKLSPDELFAAIIQLAKHRGIFYLSPEDLVTEDGSNQSSADIIRVNESKLKEGIYPCHVQLEKLNTTGTVRGIENKFTHESYRNELIKLLEVQSAFYPRLEEIIDDVLCIYDSKREYYEGPGSYKSPTPYGSYQLDESGNVIKINLIDKMRGKCTYFPDELRAPKWSYSACLFNLLNDLNNLTIQGVKITELQKQELIRDYVNKGKSVTLPAIAKICGVKKEDIFGFRIDKSEKPIFTKFEGYNELLKIAKSVNEETTIEGKKQLVDDISEILTKEKSIDTRVKKLIDDLKLSTSLAKEIAKSGGFTTYHSLSFKAINLILEDLLKTSKNQMELFTGAGIKPYNHNFNKGHQLSANLSDWIVSPVVKRSINETIKVFNALRKYLKVRYGDDAEFSDVVVELAREKNSQEKKDLIKKIQKANEEKRYKIMELVENRKLTSAEFERISLLLEQDFKCAYSLEPIELSDVFKVGLLEVDHIIPLSISLSDAQSNKVLVYQRENQAKGQRSPFQYFSSGKAKITFESFKEYVTKNLNFSNAKKRNLLYLGNPIEDVKGFIDRNLVDTRYASRETYNLLKSFFDYHQINTKVKVINGSATSYFRKRAYLPKNRDETYAHHAQDAMIIAGFANTKLMKFFSKIGAFSESLNNKDSIAEVDGNIINSETGEVLEQELFDKSENVSNYIKFLKRIESIEPLYSHKVDRKPNRALYDQQIKATRSFVEGNKETTYVITKYSDIYNTGTGNSGAKLKKRILESPEDLLMYHHDTKTFDIFLKIVEQYGEESNPFAAYKEDHGPIRKYSKKGNGPIIESVKFRDKQLGSHRVNKKQDGHNKSVFLKIKSLRTDVYQDGDNYLVLNVPYDMVCFINGRYIINQDKYYKSKQAQKISDSAKFVMSLYRGDYITYEEHGEIVECIFKCINNEKMHRIEISYVNRPTDKQVMKGIKTSIRNLIKYNVDVLGNKYKVTNEKLEFDVTI
ncbi:type II CRISPR RNA-guided endonuclease Cas9 [uncultured Veillonella sp.]|uniref:type II CRISPR RNA-guided endonuclease Cas9 n=1 Tax=uncultured Veillonella sp. TaxID=159268 RepID=UPI0028049628|nr:type II CRISPR RNA-guided endonuclease Cas9 [uncultured Veillonella sp.]